MSNIVPNLSLDGSLGSIDRYISIANSYPFLSPEEELALAQRLLHDNDVDAARQLVLSHLRLVISIARGYLGYGLPHADLIQEGNIGLMKAVKRFDPNRGVRLVSFASYWIKAEIHEFIIRNWRLVKVATTKAQRKLFFNLRSQKKTDKALTPTEIAHIAATLDVTPHDITEMELRLYGHEVNIEGDDDPHEGLAPIDWLADPHAEPCHALTTADNHNRQMTSLQQALATLDERTRRIIEARWLNPDKTTTLQALADEFNLTAERIRQIEAQALKKMRHLIATA